MKKNLKYFSLLLFPIAIFINFLASKYPAFVESYYSQKINKFIIQILNSITGIIPFSLYEVSMYLIVISIIFFIVYLTYTVFNNRCNFKRFLFKSTLSLLSFLSIAYFLFIILWGINYNRLPLEDTLIAKYNSENSTNISKSPHTTDDLSNLYRYLINETNNIRRDVLENDKKIMVSNTDYKNIISRAQIGYDNISNIIPSISGNYSLPKYVRSSNLMSYTGITGIYFPWTGEANVNISIPDIYIPSTTTHEMAHQRGFASEDEANFLAYLSCINHPDVDFKYSGLVLALNHTESALRKYDYDTYKELGKNISPDVLRDLENNRQYWSRYEGKVDTISNNFNSVYLKSNGIKEGTKNYSKMINLLITYYKLYSFD
ncbi:MAG: DUF3810 domain-containing protein [Peptostreptococcaceae bacterium]